MAQLNITLNQEEIQQLLTNDRNEAFKKLLQESLNSVSYTHLDVYKRQLQNCRFHFTGYL